MPLLLPCTSISANFPLEPSVTAEAATIMPDIMRDMTGALSACSPLLPSKAAAERQMRLLSSYWRRSTSQKALSLQACSS